MQEAKARKAASRKAAKAAKTAQIKAEEAAATVAADAKAELQRQQAAQAAAVEAEASAAAQRSAQAAAEAAEARAANALAAQAADAQAAEALAAAAKAAEARAAEATAPGVKPAQPQAAKQARRSRSAHCLDAVLTVSVSSCSLQHSLPAHISSSYNGRPTPSRELPRCNPSPARAPHEQLRPSQWTAMVPSRATRQGEPVCVIVASIHSESCCTNVCVCAGCMSAAAANVVVGSAGVQSVCWCGLVSLQSGAGPGRTTRRARG